FIYGLLSGVKLPEANEGLNTHFFGGKLIASIWSASRDLICTRNIRKRLFIHLGVQQSASDNRQRPNLAADIAVRCRCRKRGANVLASRLKIPRHRTLPY